MSQRASGVEPTHGWWHDAVIYQVYPRSFAATNGTGLGDLRGIASRLPALRDLGVDAVWLSPFYASPQKDAGYDVADYCDVDPIFGTLADFDHMLTEAHGLGLKVIIDLVPNHSSDQHAWFQEALASEAGSPERARYIFRDGKGEHGELPPNNWDSVFGGPAWTRTINPDGTPGQWYLHLFDSSQPDFDWTNPEVWDMFDEVLRFWLGRGVDGFRIDVAHGLIKEAGLPDVVNLEDESRHTGGPFWDQDGVHEVYRRWNSVLKEFGDDRILTAEAWVMPLKKMAYYVRPGEMHQAFNFGYLTTRWDANDLKKVIDESLDAFPGVGAPATWVLSNHDVVRHTSRLGLNDPQGVQPTGLGPRSPRKPDPELSLRRGRAATALMLALPGSSYLYQGEELGLLEVIDIPDESREDPTFRRTGGERYGRDGCRVPIPWEKDAHAFGFAPAGTPWLPQPAWFAEFARDQQEGDPSSTLELYRTLLRVRREYGLGAGEVRWVDSPEGVVSFDNGPVRVVTNISDQAVTLPKGRVIASSLYPTPDMVEPDHTVWVLRD